MGCASSGQQKVMSAVSETVKGGEELFSELEEKAKDGINNGITHTKQIMDSVVSTVENGIHTIGDKLHKSDDNDMPNEESEDVESRNIDDTGMEEAPSLPNEPEMEDVANDNEEMHIESMEDMSLPADDLMQEAIDETKREMDNVKSQMEDIEKNMENDINQAVDKLLGKSCSPMDAAEGSEEILTVTHDNSEMQVDKIEMVTVTDSPSKHEDDSVTLPTLWERAHDLLSISPRPSIDLSEYDDITGDDATTRLNLDAKSRDFFQNHTINTC